MRKALFFALALVALVVAACGGSQQTAVPTTAPAAPQAGAGQAAAPTTAPKADSPTAAAPAAPAKSANAPAKNAVRINVATSPDNLDPQRVSFSGEIAHDIMIYQGLMMLGQDLKAVPGAAESMQVSEDGKTYTFKLKPGLKYSDGQPLTAKNFEFAWKRAADPNVNGEYQSSTFIIEGAEAYATADLKKTSEADLKALRDKMAVKALDDQTIQFKLVKPAAYFPYVATLWIGWPAREDMVAKGEDWWIKAENHVGNGPFILKTFKEKEFATFVPNPNWSGEKPTVDEVTFRYIVDSKVAFEAYKSGELDIIPLAAEDQENALKDPTLSKEVVRYPGGCTYGVMANETKEPFGKADARLAVGRSIDREAWVRDVLRGQGKATTSWLAPDVPGFRANAGDFLKNDPAAAKAAWQKAAFNGEVKLTYSSSPRNKVRYEFIAAQLQQSLGITPVLDPVEATTYTAMTKDITTAPQLFILGWCADYPDPENFLSVYWRSNSGFAQRVGFKNADFDKLVDQADQEKDPQKRIQLYQQAEDIVLKEVATAPLWNNEIVYLIKPYTTYGKTTMRDSTIPGWIEPWKFGVKR